VLALKLFLVPFFLAIVSHVSRRWGPGVGGWLAGLPLVTGPILFILALENDAAFTAQAAASSLSAVASGIIFGAVYSHLCLRNRWPVAASGGIGAWLLVSAGLAELPGGVLPAAAAAATALLAAPRLFPSPPEVGALRAGGRFELPLRMTVAVLLVLFTTGIADRIGSQWTGLIAMFPVVSTVLAVSSHQGPGPGFAVTLLRALARGLYAIAGYCVVIALFLPQWGVALTYLAAVAAALVTQWFTRPRPAPNVHDR